MIKKKIVILGSTGEIGRHALNIVDRFPDQLQVVGLSCYHDSDLFRQQLAQYQPTAHCIASQNPAGLVQLASMPAADLIIIAVVGAAGIEPAVAAITSHHHLALATKEVLVIAGQQIMALARQNNVKILPIDSEHSAIFQSLQSGQINAIAKIYLTMGKGKIAQLSPTQMSKLTPSEVMQTNHWVMGKKITLDSATCVNKVFEAIEAARLFNLHADQIQVTVHPEYLCHSLVEFVDGSIIGEFGTANMDRYLQYVLTYPTRQPAPPADHLSLLDQKLSFLTPDYQRFPILTLIPRLINSQLNLAAVFHGADEACAHAFWAEQIKFTDFYPIFIQTLDQFEQTYISQNATATVDTDLQLEKIGQDLAQQIIESKSYVST